MLVEHLKREIIIIQGDYRNQIMEILNNLGFKTKRWRIVLCFLKESELILNDDGEYLPFEPLANNWLTQLLLLEIQIEQNHVSSFEKIDFEIHKRNLKLIQEFIMVKESL